jgi:hypothetical protein
MPDDIHELVSFEDPDLDRTWVFDITFLTSGWRCVFGDGCQGVLTEAAPELDQGCCSYGAHFVDEADEANMLSYVDRLTPEVWQFHRQGHQRGTTKTSKAGDITTRLVDGACIFLNRPGFEGGIGCALHTAALAAGERPLDWKPTVCWQLPLRLDDQTEDDGHVTSTLREWKRRDWGDGGAEFHWWCTEDPEAFIDHEPVYETMRDEIVETVGQRAYDMFVEHVSTRRTEQYLPHPALRKR